MHFFLGALRVNWKVPCCNQRGLTGENPVAIRKDNIIDNIKHSVPTSLQSHYTSQGQSYVLYGQEIAWPYSGQRL